MKRFKFEMSGSYIFYSGYTMGCAIKAFIQHRPEHIVYVTAITEEPFKDYELP